MLGVKQYACASHSHKTLVKSADWPYYISLLVRQRQLFSSYFSLLFALKIVLFYLSSTSSLLKIRRKLLIPSKRYSKLLFDLTIITLMSSNGNANHCDLHEMIFVTIRN